MPNSDFTVKGHIIDVVSGRIFQGEVIVSDGMIREVKETVTDSTNYLLPGLVDAHIHIESSMLVPSEFARLAAVHGSVATVSDPHEIANVLGIDGVEFMIMNGKKVPFKFYFGAPSCVPATPFETSGAALGNNEIEILLKNEEIKYLSEMMNFPGVLNGDPDVMSRLEIARRYGKPVDGHAPGLRGEQARKYIGAGISTDHECFSIEEAREKIRYGMKVLIREGSAARNFDELAPLIAESPGMVMFCSDDRHPDDLVQRHMDDLVRRALRMGLDPVDVIRACTLNPARHYGLETGLLQAGDPADFIIVDDLDRFNILKTYIDGILVAEKGRSLIPATDEKTPNKFNARELVTEDIRTVPGGETIKVIEALEGQLITHELEERLVHTGMPFECDLSRDILKLVVLNRYEPAIPAVAFIHGFGLKEGAIASTVAHDSHNIIAVGTSDSEIVRAVNALIAAKGGICCTHHGQTDLLPLPVAGLMSNNDGYAVASHYERLTQMARQMGCSLRSPFMTLSFMALLVIPDLKLSDRGLFDGKSFSFTSGY